LAVAATFVLALLPSTRSAFQSNLGAVSQTRAELGLYAWPKWPLQDAVRRSGLVDLAPAMQHYELALRLNPANVSANRRLGQIELSLGQYELAARHLQAAHDAAPAERPARQLLAEIRAITGLPQSAAELWRTIPLAQQQLELRQQWYNDVGEPEKAALIADGARLAGWQ
jgi:tetratricopeptide (TPR) repeat protein